MSQNPKELLRQKCHRSTPAQVSASGGRIAEHLRRLERYRKASVVFIEPSLLLRQARINALADGKVLIIPGAGLKDGFYRLEPYRIPFSQLPRAVSGRELGSFGVKISSAKDFAGTLVNFMVREAWLADRRGYCLGEGKGFFDLSVAILNELGALDRDFQVAGVVRSSNLVIEEIPACEWDVAGDLLLTPDGVVEVVVGDKRGPVIVWPALTLDRIRRITPLWKIYVEQGLDRQA